MRLSDMRREALGGAREYQDYAQVCHDEWSNPIFCDRTETEKHRRLVGLQRSAARAYANARKLVDAAREG